MPSSEHFRAGVGIVVIDRDGRVLGLERCDVPGSWQLPQGGIGRDEEPFDAARRELHEETGIGSHCIELLGEHPSWLAYELPASHRSSKTGRGQVHRWFLARFVGDDTEIDLTAGDGDREFCDWRWMHMEDLVASTWEIRRPVYRSLQTFWSDQLA